MIVDIMPKAVFPHGFLCSVGRWTENREVTALNLGGCCTIVNPSLWLTNRYAKVNHHQHP